MMGVRDASKVGDFEMDGFMIAHPEGPSRVVSRRPAPYLTFPTLLVPPPRGRMCVAGEGAHVRL
jgi:hypothetical protein